jgi:hypothetical protein
MRKLDQLLVDYELFDSALGRLLRDSQHISAWRAGKAELAAWETSGLGSPSRFAENATYQIVSQTLGFDAALADAPTRRGAPNRWGWDDVERLDGFRLIGRQATVHFQRGREKYTLTLGAPPLEAEATTELAELLNNADRLERLARGKPLTPRDLVHFGLVPAWSACTVRTDARLREVLETGARFLSRALASFPAYLLIWRGVRAEPVLGDFLRAALERHQEDLAAALAELVPAAEHFWTAPPLPGLPLPQQLSADIGLGAHLPPVDFWPRPEDNAMFNDAVQRLYRSVPRKVQRMVEPRR